MTNEQYGKMVRTIYRIFGWTCIASIIFAPLGIWVLYRGNRVYKSYIIPQTPGGRSPANDPAFGNNVMANSLILSFDDYTAFDNDPSV